MNIDWQHDASPLPDAVLADFPGAASIFDTAKAARTLLAAGAIDETTAQAGLSVQDVRYMAGRALRVVYACRGGNDAMPRILSVDFLRKTDAASALRSAAPPPGTVPAWGAVVSAFPDDRALDGLSRLIDATTISARLSETIGMPLAAASMRWRLLSYLPGKRAALRLDWSDVGASIVAKMNASAVSGHGAMAALWSAPGRRFRMAEPLLALPELPARFERFVAGERLESLASGGTGTGSIRRDLLRPVVEGLAALHGSRLEGLAARPPEDLLRRVRRKVLPHISAVLPQLAPRATALVDALAAAVPPPGPPCMLHGDLHTANLLLDAEGHAVFIDLDDLCLGDPELDLAQLGTRLALGAARQGNTHSMLATAAELPLLYAEAGGTPPDERSYAWYVAMLLVGRQVKTCIRRLAPDLPRLAARLLDAAEATWQQGAVRSESQRTHLASVAGSVGRIA